MKLQTKLCRNMLNQNIPYTNTKLQNMWKIENNPKLISLKSFFGPREPNFTLKNINENCTTKITFRATHKSQKAPTRPFCASRVWRPRRENKKSVGFPTRPSDLVNKIESSGITGQQSTVKSYVALHCTMDKTYFWRPILLFIPKCVFRRNKCNLIHDCKQMQYCNTGYTAIYVD